MTVHCPVLRVRYMCAYPLVTCTQHILRSVSFFPFVSPLTHCFWLADAIPITEQKQRGALPQVPNSIIHLCSFMFVTTGQACIVMEYMDGGDLHSFLRNIKGSQRLSHSHTMNLQEVEKLDIASQIARGLEFLASKKVLEGSFPKKPPEKLPAFILCVM